MQLKPERSQKADNLVLENQTADREAIEHFVENYKLTEEEHGVRFSNKQRLVVMAEACAKARVSPEEVERRKEIARQRSV